MGSKRCGHGLPVLLFVDLGPRNLRIDDGVVGKLGEQRWEVSAVDGLDPNLDNIYDSLLLAAALTGLRNRDTWKMDGHRDNDDGEKERNALDRARSLTLLLAHTQPPRRNWVVGGWIAAETDSSAVRITCQRRGSSLQASTTINRERPFRVDDRHQRHSAVVA